MVILQRRSQFWLHVGTVWLALHCFCYYNHTEWSVSENTAPLPDCLKCLCSTRPPVNGRKEEINTSPAWGLSFWEMFAIFPITTVNIYAPYIGAPQYIRQTLTDIKGEIGSNTIIVGDFNSHSHQWTDHQNRKLIRKHKRNKRNPDWKRRSKALTVCGWHDTAHRKP